MKTKKERIFYYDFLRAFAIIAVIICHVDHFFGPLVGTTQIVAQMTFHDIGRIGVPIFLAGKKRFCYDNTIFMYHQLSAREPWLTVKQKENNLKVLIENMSQIRKIILKNTNINIKLLEDWDSKNQDFYINSKNALDFGIVHEIIGGE